MIQYAADLGLDAAAFARCLDDGEFAGGVDADMLEARRLGIRGTPTFLVNGRRLVGAHPIESFREVIEEALRNRTRRR